MVASTVLWNPICANLRQRGPDVRRWLREVVFTRENFLALVLALMLIVILIFAADSSPTWIYQGF